MALPADETEQRDFLRFVANGNEDAAQYLWIMAQTARLADDLADEALTPRQRQDMLARLLHATFCLLPFNPFHQRYGREMATVLADVIVQWAAADDWRTRADPKRQVFGFVRRENMDSLAIAVSAITGGIEHARAVNERLMDDVHNTGETLDSWLSEGKS